MSIRHYINLLEQEQPLSLEPLQYSTDQFEPVLSQQSITFHYNKLARAYVDRFNQGQGDADFNRAGAYLHNLLFAQWAPPKANNQPHGPSAQIIDSVWGSWNKFQQEFLRVAMSIQGSGWIYMDHRGLLHTVANHQIKPNIALLVDWWEHAFYTDYGPARDRYLENQWRIIDWAVINDRITVLTK
jgi:superoxide dismutase, Fe-Mn family